jgi:flagellar motor switch/type III secretory pathway protein FliN
MALPFDLPMLSRGYAELGPAVRAAGREAAAAAAGALREILGVDVRLDGWAAPGRPAPRAAVARLAVDLAALPGTAALDVDAPLAAALADLLAGGPGAGAGATHVTPLEAAALELFVLAALEGASRAPGVEGALGPHLARGSSPDPAGALAVELRVGAGPVSGTARLLLPPAALRALRRGAPTAADAAGGTLRIPAALRGGELALSRPERDALAEGDVLVLEPADAEPRFLVLPGGARARGRVVDDQFHVEEIMAERSEAVPVLLAVELARVEVAVADLARLEPGGALPLGLDRRGLVTLRCGERAIARGELVDVDGAIGVRILSLEGAP